VQVLDEGDPRGSPIVLIHGYTASMHWFDELAPLLAEKHRVIRVDTLGHGGSEKPGAGYSMKDQANAVALALGELDVEDATVVGHSMGGTVATALAEQSPEIATRIVIVDQAPDDSYEDLSFSAKLGTTPVIGQALSRLVQIGPSSAVRGQFEQAFAPGFNMASGFEDPDQVVEDLKEMTYTSFKDSVEEEGDYSGERPLHERLSSAQVPLLVIFGAEDQIYDAEDAMAPYEDIPGVQTVLLPDVGHSPNVEAPEVLAPLILTFADQADKRQRDKKAANQQRKAEAQAKKEAARKKRQAEKRAEAKREAAADDAPGP
jgi:pimeloyl-ACP methyl ester carboxylesterase